MEKLLAFIDLLGFSNMVNNYEQKAREVLNDFYNISFTEIKKHPKVNGHLFSDSLLAYSESESDLINCLATIFKKCLLKNKDYKNLSKFYILPRGAISKGIVNIENRRQIPNLKKDFIISTALVHSAKLESKIKGSRLLVAYKKDLDKSNLPPIYWNREIKYSLYKDDAFSYLENYNYKDVLWFSGSNDKSNLVELIDIAIKLVKDNAKNEKVIEQHIWTLRIGLLSYTTYLGLNKDYVLKRIINEFKADKYWLIWMTLIEMIVTSSNEWKYAVNDEIIKFYKRNFLKPGWSKIIEEINKPNQKYVLYCFERFINEMQIITD